VNVAERDTSAEPARQLGPRARSQRMRLAVLGGTSSGIPAFIEALRTSQEQGRLGTIDVRLVGRDPAKLAGVHSYITCWLRSRAEAPCHELSLTVHTQLSEAVEGATHVLCMVRPGGMAGRARDEALARAAGVPADEGIAVGGLACFLRGRQIMQALAKQCRESAPSAIFLQMSSPLGLNVAITREAFGSAAYGVCELPLVTKKKVLRHVASRLPRECVSARCAGLNHQSWLYAFTDQAGRDCTADVLGAIDGAALVDVESEIIRDFGAVPMPYLRLYLHTERVLAEQAGSRLRGSELASWTNRLDQAFRRASACTELIRGLLAERRMNWFEEGVLPVLEAFSSDEGSCVPLNVPCAGALAGIAAESIIEIDCSVSSSGAVALPVPPLPAKPLALTLKLVAYERAVLELPAAPSSGDLAEILSMHPIAPMAGIARTSRALSRIRPEILQPTTTAT
jgi:6-phospho-beta-glucosidase